MEHNGTVNGALFNHDGTGILTWKNDAARLRYATDGSPIGQPMKLDSTVIGGVFNHDETRVLAWSDKGGVGLWDAADGSPIVNPMKHEGMVRGAVFDRDETRILAWYTGTARIWDATNGSLIGTLEHSDSVNGGVFNHDETQILTWSDDGKARLWDATDGSLIGTLKHNGPVRGALFNHDEAQILTWSDDGTAQLWNIAVDEDFPKGYLPLMVEVATGATMDDYGNVIALSKEKWEAYKNEYIDVCEEHLKTCQNKQANLYLNHQKKNWGKR